MAGTGAAAAAAMGYTLLCGPKWRVEDWGGCRRRYNGIINTPIRQVTAIGVPISITLTPSDTPGERKGYHRLGPQTCGFS